MTGALLDRPASAGEQAALDGGGTLAELLSSALGEAQANGSTACPVCHARMSFARAGAREAECSGCGSRLS
jgi:transcription initiation factor IIE alpha subunit